MTRLPTLSDLSVSQKKLLIQQIIELPSWAFGNSGTRFKVFGSKGAPRNPFEKISDAGQVQFYTGVAKRISLHIPWDYVENYEELAQHAIDQGLRIGMINSNLFQDDEYRLGSLCNPEKKIRQKAIDHHKYCVEVMNKTGSKDLKIWLPDGTNYPGQDSLFDRQERLSESLHEIYGFLAPDQRLILEYKLFEPYFYSMDLPDWGSSLLHCLALGDRAKVCLDTGHHAPHTNVEFIVAQLLRIERLGAFDFNSRFYADDDLIVGAADPFQLFRIMHEIVSFGALNEASNVRFMLDQCHNLEDKIAGEIRSVLNVQEATAKALLVDQEALEGAQNSGDILTANGILMDAFSSDVRELLAELRAEMNVPQNPLKTFAESGYMERVSEERVGGTSMSWGA